MIPLKDDNPTRLVPVVSWTLLAACLLVFLWQISLGPEGMRAAIYAYGLVPDALLGGGGPAAGSAAVPAPLTVFTSMFLHGGWLHLIGNLLYLWIFADNVEDSMGHGRFVVFYLLCGVAAALAQALPAPDSQIPMIGASGAISGVLGAYLLLHPRAHVLVLIPLGFFVHIARLPAMLVLGFWFLLQLLSEAAAGDGAGVAFRAHIGGFVAGMALIPLLKRPRVPLFR